MRYHGGWMISVLSFLVLSILSSRQACHATGSSPPRDEMLIKHKWDTIPENWVSLGQPTNGTTIKLHIALKANRENALIDALHEVSHPRHPKYGMHLSREKVTELVAPHPDTLELVCSWLKFNGVPPSSISMTNGGSWLTVAGVPVSKANELLGASYELYYHAWTNETILRTVGYALPAGLHMHVKTVAPTTAFTYTRPLQQTPRSHSDGEPAPARANGSLEEPWDMPSRRNDEYIEPSFLRWLYRMPFNYPTAPNLNKLGIAGFINQIPNQRDLYMFMARFRSDADPMSAATQIVTIVPVNGGVEWRSQPGMRANFDTQYSVALTYPTQVAYYTIGGDQRSDPNGPPRAGDHYLEWLLYMIGLEIVPQTISVPYFLRETYLSAAYMERLCFLFGVLGSRGASVLVPSGDFGVGRGSCKDRSGNVQFFTVFPASCPWVTSVGGTTSYDPEVGYKRSGGGFSAFFERPLYQTDAVNAFFDKLGSRYTGKYNHLDRGVPDIAMQSIKYALIWQGDTSPESLTGSTNTAAAIIALLNDFLVANDKHPLGFLNYWLYEAGLYWDGLNDIILGKNPGCNTQGFSAMVGWDPVTGLGSLNYTLLLQHLIKWS